MRTRIITLVFCLVSIVGFSQTKNVLYIGNSYIFSNDLPSIISEVAKAHTKNINYEEHCLGGARFKTYWENINNSGLLAKIEKGDWDYVVLQGQSQEVAFPDGQFYSDVHPYAEQLDSLIKEKNPNADVVYFMTWGYRYGDHINCQYFPPFCTFGSMTARLYDNYTILAQDFSSSLCPIGASWRYSFVQDSTKILHSSDNSHPSLLGSYLTALGFYTTFFKDSISTTSPIPALSQEDKAYLRDISNRVVYDSLFHFDLSSLNEIDNNALVSELIPNNDGSGYLLRVSNLEEPLYIETINILGVLEERQKHVPIQGVVEKNLIKNPSKPELKLIRLITTNSTKTYKVML